MSQEQGQFPPQQQVYPGQTDAMRPEPGDEMAQYVGSGLLAGKHALITGGDSGIGRAVAVAFAKEGAAVAIAYLTEDKDANHTKQLVEAAGQRCVAYRADLSGEENCRQVVENTVHDLGGLDIVVNNIAYQERAKDLAELPTDQWLYTFAVNIHSYFWVTKFALNHLPDGAAIINTGSVNGLRGNKSLLDYSATKGAVHSFTYALSQALAPRRIRVNCVAPGPVWTPLIPATAEQPEDVEKFGGHVPMGRAAQPDEIAPSFVFLAAEAMSSYYSGEILAPLGGEVHPG